MCSRCVQNTLSCLILVHLQMYWASWSKSFHKDYTQKLSLWNQAREKYFQVVFLRENLWVLQGLLLLLPLLSQLECFLRGCSHSLQFSDAPCFKFSHPGISSFCSSCLHSFTGQGRARQPVGRKNNVVFSHPGRTFLSHLQCAMVLS